MRKSRVFFGVATAVAVTISALPMVFAADRGRPSGDEQVRPAAVESSVVYGIDDANVIWEIDPINKTFGKVNDTTLTGKSNSMAYDTGRDQFFFIYQTDNFSIDNSLRAWNRSSTGPLSVPQAATRTQLGLPAQSVQPANASYYANAYWFIPQNSTILHKVAFTYTGDTPGTPTLTTYDLSTYAAPAYPGGGFGDIAIDDTGVLYGSHTSGGRFFKIDLNLLGSTANNVYTQLKAPTGTDPGYQLSFDATFDTLFAHDFNDGAWYTIDKANGNLTSLNFSTPIPGGVTGFRDLGGASETNAPANCAISDPANTNNQSTEVSTPVTNPPAVLITDVNGDPVEAVDVTFAVASGGGTLGGQPTAVSATNVGGLATAPAWTLGPNPGANTVTATVGTLCTLTFTATGLTPAVPSIELTKTRSGTGALSAAGETVTWGLVATNTGDVTLTGVTIDDPLVGQSNACGTLAPQATCTWTVVYALTQADVDAGEVVNDATVVGTHPGGTVDDEAGSTVPVTQTPAIGLQKRAEFLDPPKAGQTISYQLLSVNTGNVTLTDVTITDTLAGLTPLVCDRAAPVTLTPGQTLTCTTSYTLTQSDIDTGELVNNATTRGVSPSQEEVSADATLTAPLTLTPTIELTKQLASHGDTNRNGIYDPGDTLTWTVTGKNAGNTTLFNAAIVDPLTGDRKDCGTLTPEQTCVLTTKAYTITENDGRVGRVLNDASIAAVSPTGADVSDFANNTVPVEGGGVVTPAAAALPQTGATVETLFWAALALLIGGALTLIIRHRPEGV